MSLLEANVNQPIGIIRGITPFVSPPGRGGEGGVRPSGPRTGDRGTAHPGGVSSSLDSFRIKVTDEPRWHPFQMREILRMQSRLRIRGLGLDAEGEPYVVNKGAICRYSDEGVMRSKARLYSFIDYLRAEGRDVTALWFLTLTTAHSTSGSYLSMASTIDTLRGGWGGVRKILHKRDIEYLRIIEPGEKKGYPHYHIILSGASQGDIDSIIHIWCNKYHLGVPEAQKGVLVEDIEYAGSYIWKYVSKNIEGEMTPQLVRWAELCYRKDVRVFGMTKRASQWIAAKYRDPIKGLGTAGPVEVMYEDDDEEERQGV
jgi:hypothetical protein